MFYRYYEAKSNHAETLVLSHDLGLNSDCWDEILERLNERYSILTYDLRGHGRSSYGEISWDHFCADLKQLIDRLNITQYHLIGHGFGSRILEKYAVQYPEWQGKIVLISPPRIYSKDNLEKQLGKLSFIMNRSKTTYADYILPTKTLSHPNSVQYQKLHQIIQSSNYEINKQLLELLLNSYSSFTNMRRVKQGVLVLLGEHDIFNTVCYAGLTSFFLMNCRLRIIDNASNLVFIDNPDDTVQQILNFLQQKIAPFHSADRDEVMEDLYNLVSKYMAFEFAGDRQTLPRLQVNLLDSIE